MAEAKSENHAESKPLKQNMPTLKVENLTYFTCIFVTPERHNEWIRLIIGKNGSRLQNLDKRYDTSTRFLETEEMIRIMIGKGSKWTTEQNRLDMADYIQREITKILTRE